jgi:hypothetical protein
VCVSHGKRSPRFCPPGTLGRWIDAASSGL